MVVVVVVAMAMVVSTDDMEARDRAERHRTLSFSLSHLKLVGASPESSFKMLDRPLQSSCVIVIRQVCR